MVIGKIVSDKESIVENWVNGIAGKRNPSFQHSILPIKNSISKKLNS